MKKALWFSIGVVVAVIANAEYVSAATPVDACFTTAPVAGGVTITNYTVGGANNCPTDVDISAQISGQDVVSITGPTAYTGAFQNKGLTTVTIPSGVLTIGTNAFRGSGVAGSLTLPSTVTSIGQSAFYGNSLTHVTIPDSVASIGSFVFGHNSLETVEISGNLTTIPQSAFSSNNLTAVEIPDGVTEIGDFAFSSSGVQTLSLPSTLTHIGARAFFNSEIESLYVPDSVTTIGRDAFLWNKLTSLRLSNSLTYLANDVFFGNYLQTVTIPSSVTEIDDGAFAANRLRSVTVPDSVTTLHRHAFYFQNDWGRDIEWDESGAPYLYSDDASEVQQVYGSMWYTRIYTETSSNPNSLQNGVMTEQWWLGDDANVNGVDDALGGHLINPASLSLNYVDQRDKSLQTSRQFTGEKSPQIYLSNYYVSQGPVVPAPANPYNPTPAEQAAIDEALAAYYRIGQTVTITPPAIAGYLTPPTQTYVLSATTTEADIVYTQPDEAAEQAIDELADTGVSVQLFTMLAASAFVAAGVVLRVRGAW